jgi:hypothetical protein
MSADRQSRAFKTPLVPQTPLGGAYMAGLKLTVDAFKRVLANHAVRVSSAGNGREEEADTPFPLASTGWSGRRSSARSSPFPARASLIVRHPRVRLAFSHGGRGAFGLVMPRLMHGCWSLVPVTGLIERLPLEQARGLYHARWSMTSRRCAS